MSPAGLRAGIEGGGLYAPPGAALSEALLRQAARAAARARSVSTSPSPSR